MKPPSVEKLVDGILRCDRTQLGRALTLVESNRPDHQESARELLSMLAERPPAEATRRIGISGLPGAGKSTLIETLGRRLIEEHGHRVAVLAVDPSSTQTGGSILGDKTRMATLALDSRAFVRPSPSGGSLGGVARRTQESMRVLEAAGFDVVFVETVGVGQSEAAVAAMVDTFVVLLVPGTGDELQGIKRGILELVDLLVINKADGATIEAAERARRDYALALHLLRSETSDWQPRVLPVSALEGTGIDALWEALEAHRAVLIASGRLDERRAEQRVRWMWRLIEEGVIDRARARLAADPEGKRYEAAVREGKTLPATAAHALLDRMRSWIEC